MYGCIGFPRAFYLLDGRSRKWSLITAVKAVAAAKPIKLQLRRRLKSPYSA